MLLNSIKISGLLSFRDVELEMRPLNVLVGANASGKSNLIETMALLQAAPRDLAGFFSRSGGVGDWFYRGERPDSDRRDSGTVEVAVAYADGPLPLCYTLTVAAREDQLHIVKERLDNPNTALSYPNGPGADLAGKSLLTPEKYGEPGPEIDYVRRQFDAIRLYREWNMGPNSPIRRPQPTDLPADFLDEDFTNLAPVLKRLEGMEAMSVIDEQLGRFYETYEQVGVTISANTAQLWIREKGINNPVPVPRLSDGTLRFLALLTILCHPDPPPLVCIEEPELGLHPDLMHLVAKLLLAASERTQLIVTTQSADLLDLLWEDPESIVTFDLYPDTGTEVTRLNKERFKSSLEKCELGELWRSGHIGGTRY